MTDEDYYINDEGKVVFTKEYHLRRSYCCGSGCLHCPFEPKHMKGNKNVTIGERDRPEDSSTGRSEG